MKMKMSAAIAIVTALVLALCAPAFAAISEKVEIPVEIALEGSVLDAKDEFTVELTAVTEGAPMPAEGNSVKITGAGSASFKMEYTELGVYSYTIKQVAGSAKGVTYDDAVYTLTVSVIVGEDGKVGSVVALKGPDGTKVDEALFTNKYETPEPAKLDPPIK